MDSQPTKPRGCLVLAKRRNTASLAGLKAVRLKPGARYGSLHVSKTAGAES